jgi:hypothetical protein
MNRAERRALDAFLGACKDGGMSGEAMNQAMLDVIRPTQAGPAAAPVPEGWKFVPKAPTSHMMNQAATAWHRWNGMSLGGNVQSLGALIWEHMIDCAPTPPSSASTQGEK